MGVYCHYQAWPADGRLLARLRTEPHFYALYAALLHHPAGPFDRAPAADESETLDEIAGREEFGSRAVVDRALTDLRAEQEVARESHTGLERRSAYMKLHDDFDRALVGELGRLGHPDPAGYAARLVMGWEPLAPHLFPGRASALQCVPAPVVADAAGWLERVRSEPFGWLADDFRSWRRVYADAAARGEAVVIG